MRDEVRELLHDGYPVACLGDAPFGYVNVFTSHVNVGFFHGASLSDPAANCLPTVVVDPKADSGTEFLEAMGAVSGYKPGGSSPSKCGSYPEKRRLSNRLAS